MEVGPTCIAKHIIGETVKISLLCLGAQPESGMTPLALYD